jgi:hypothetical protein
MIQWYREEQGKHHYGFEYAYIKEEDREKIRSIFEYYSSEAIYS